MGILTPRFLRDEDGASTVWSIFWAIVFLIMGGLVIDTSNAYRHKAALQATADASSLAAIISYTEEDKFDAVFGVQNPPPANASARGKLAGHLLANTNMDPTRAQGTVTPESEVTMGFWDGSTFLAEADFTGSEDVNAAKVRSLRTSSNNNPLNLLLVDMLGQASTWDVGATSIAMTYTPPNCPTKEGIMAGGVLDFSSNNTFVGDLCLHGEIAGDFNGGNAFQDNLDGDYPTVSYGVGGGLCKGNCSNEEPWSNVLPFQDATDPLEVSMVDPEATHMPDVPQIYGYLLDSATNPMGGGDTDGDGTLDWLQAGSGHNRYYPDALVTNPDRDYDEDDVELVSLPEVLTLTNPDGTPVLDANGDPVTDDQLDPVRNALPTGAVLDTTLGVMRVTISANDFVNAVNGATGTGSVPFPANAIIDVDYTAGSCGNANGRMTLTGDAPLEDMVIATPCRVILNGTNRIAGSTVISTWNGSSAAISGSSGAILGAGTCDDDSDGSTFVTAGEIHFAAGMQVNGSRVISMGDVHIAALGDGMRGTQILGNQDVKITSGTEWQGCPNGLDIDTAEVDHYYQLVN